MTSRAATLSLNGTEVGPGRPTYIAAEVGFNHEGRLPLAQEMVRAAAEAGADAVKFQTYRADRLTLQNSPHFELIKHGELTRDDYRALAAECGRSGIAFFSTPFDPDMVALLESLDTGFYKIASMDLTNGPLLAAVAATGKPVWLSTGMATLGEIDHALNTLAKAGGGRVLLLHCMSIYPAPAEAANLATIGQLRDAFQIPVGYSDHVLGNAAALASVALGACAIEKHFTTNKNLPGPDHRISMDTGELKDLVEGARAVEKAMGRACADLSRPDRENAAATRRGVYAAADIAAGTVLTPDLVKIVRPQTPLGPDDAAMLMGRKTVRDIAFEAPIRWEDV